LKLDDAADAEATVRAFLAGRDELPAEWAALEVFQPVRSVKSRQDCVLLPFRALSQALAGAEPKDG